MSKFEDVYLFHDGIVADGERRKCFRFAEGDKWLPKSQIRSERTLQGKNGPVHEVVIPRWLAENEGLV